METLTEAPTAPLTYEAYMAEPETKGRYDIVNGVRISQPQVTWQHQCIIGELTGLFHEYGQASNTGKGVHAPFDLLIRRTPTLQIRQPDALFVSHARLAANGGPPKTGPLEITPELVIEIVTSSETQRILGGKVADYASIGVEECWVIRPDTRAVELLQPHLSGSEAIVVFDETQSVTSLVFSDLVVPVEDIFQS